MLADALKYASAGFQVFPLQPGTKVPATQHGKDDATTDAARIREWWTRRPDCNIAIRPPVGVIVIDVDPRNGGNVEDLGRLPVTLAARTGSDGYHLYYAIGGQFRGKLAGAEGIDIKSNSGYVVAPPSIHPNGTAYEWIQRSPVATLPRHLLDRVRPPKPKKFVKRDGIAANHDGLIRNVTKESTGEGNRNNALYWSARKAVDERAPEEVFAQLVQAGESIGLTTAECNTTIESARRSSAT